MNTLILWLTSPEWALAVKTLLHSLWQGALIAAGLMLLLRRMSNPSARYRLALAGLGAVMLAAMVTWGVLNAPGAKAVQPAAPTEPPTATTPVPAGPADKIVVAARWTAARPQTPWTAWLALAWLTGASAMLGRASVKVAGAEQLRRGCQPLDDPRINELIAEARRAVKLTRRIRVSVTNQLTSPAVVGVLVPTLILPLSLITTLSPEQIRFVLLHELAHIRRGDYLANLFQLFAEALLFFNPAVWWISHQIRREREACCDALAIQLSGAPADYARTLVSVAETVLQPSPVATLAFGSARGSSSLSDRVQRVLVPGYRPSLRLTWRAMLAALVVGGVLLGMLAVGARNTVAAAATALAPKTSSFKTGFVRETTPVELDANGSKLEFIKATDGRLSWSVTWITNQSQETLAMEQDGFFKGDGWFIYIESRGCIWMYDGVRHLDLLQQGAGRNSVNQPGIFEACPKSVLDAVPEPVRNSWRKNGAESADRSAPSSSFQMRLVQDEATADSEELAAPAASSSGKMFQEVLHVQKRVLLDQSAIKSASVGADSQVDQPVLPTVMFELTSEGRTQFAKITRENIGRQLAIIVSGKIVSAPVIRSEIPSGSVQITGSFTVEEARKLAAIISGSPIAAPPATKETPPGDSIFGQSVTFDPSEKAVTVRGNVEITTANGMRITTEEARIQMGTNSAAQSSETNLFTRTFKVDPNTFAQGLESAGGLKATNLTECMRDFLMQIGVDMRPPKSIFLSDRTGMIFVRATLEDLDVIEQAIQVLTAQPAQVNIHAKFVEVPEDAEERLLASLSLAKSNVVWASQAGNSTQASNRFAWILTASQAKAAFEALDAMPGVERRAGVEVTTLSGRQAQIQMADTKPVVTNAVSQIIHGARTNMIKTSDLPIGPVVDLIPRVLADGHTIQMTVIPTLSEFLGFGYDDPGNFVPQSGSGASAPVVTPLPLPHYRVRQTVATATVWDGQTVVLGVFKAEAVAGQPEAAEIRKPDATTVKKQLLVFITPTIVDAAGKRVHTDEEMPFARDAVPRQRP